MVGQGTPSGEPDEPVRDVNMKGHPFDGAPAPLARTDTPFRKIDPKAILTAAPTTPIASAFQGCGPPSAGKAQASGAVYVANPFGAIPGDPFGAPPVDSLRAPSARVRMRPHANGGRRSRGPGRVATLDQHKRHWASEFSAGVFDALLYSGREYEEARVSELRLAMRMAHRSAAFSRSRPRNRDTIARPSHPSQKASGQERGIR